ncbi:beta-lactamase domain-containing protein 2-like isoform X2 [Gigantopelta aegis]|nr:beta-lactamase domain-containing protein 2-like isoform X2 [Gigantopelta aegis]
MWGGYADVESQQPWENDTLSLAFSVTKSVSALTIAKMVDRGWIQYEKRVSYYWPEFGKNGKENITVEILLSHQAGLLSFGGEKISLLDFIHRPKEVVRLLEDQTPHWVPGTAHGYHAVTIGYYVGTLAQKADPKHRNLSQIFKEEIAEPLGIDFHIGLPREQHWRVARGNFLSLSQILLKTLTSPTSFRIFSTLLMYPDSLTAKSMMVLKEETSFMNRADVQASGIPSFMGLGNARSLAKLYSFVAMGGSSKGKQLLSAETMKKVLTPLTRGKDLVLLTNMTYARGLMVLNNSRGSVMFGHGGYGGQAALADPYNKLSLAYISNYLESFGLCNDPRFIDLYELVYDCLDDYLSKQ